MGALIAEELKLPASFLTHDRSSIPWAADQILRSDIRQGDLVFWALTGINRFTFWDDKRKIVDHCTLGMWLASDTKWQPERDFLSGLIKKNFMVSDTLVFESINAVHRVSNFCEKIGAVLIMGTVIRGMERALRNWPNFVVMAGTHGRNANDLFVDIGSDNRHPGKQGHRYYADSMLKTYRSFTNEN